MTGCGCLLLIAALLGLSAFLIFGSTDPGEPVETAIALFILLWSGQRQTLVPRRRALVRACDV